MDCAKLTTFRNNGSIHVVLNGGFPDMNFYQKRALFGFLCQQQYGKEVRLLESEKRGSKELFIYEPI